MYYKLIDSGYIVAIGIGDMGTPITKDEYDEILDLVHNTPEAPEGYYYRLREDKTWELTKREPLPDTEGQI